MTISLADLQRRLAGLLTAPPPVDDAERSAREEMALSLGVVGDARLDAGGRAGIYAGMWFARIHDAIAEDYPATRLALGDAAFAEMLRGYLAECPPTDPSLRHAGDRLPAISRDTVGRHIRPGSPSSQASSRRSPSPSMPPTSAR
ncbi:MAG: DNA-binding domain-containing protein [Alphaproteobacteria bacterium]